MNIKLKICLCAQSHALGTRTKFQFEIMTLNVITGIVYFREIILESSWNVSETTPRFLASPVPVFNEEIFPLPMPFQGREIVENANIVLYFLK